MGMTSCFTHLDGADMQRLQADEDLREEFYDSERFDVIDIDKAWHGVHFVLAGHPYEPGEGLEGTIIFGGTPIGLDYGMGQARVHTPPEVKAIDQALQAISPDTFTSQFDHSALVANDIYPSGWEDEDEEEGLEYLLDGFIEIKTLFSKAAEKGHAILHWKG